MRDLHQIRQRVYIVLGILGVISLGFIVYLLWPGSSVSAQKQEAENLERQYKTLKDEVAPLNGIEGKLLQTRTDIKNLYKDSVPSRASEISLRLEKISQSTGVQNQGVHYSTKINPDKDDLPGLQRLDIDTSVSGEYPSLAHFINAIEQEKLMFVIDQISLSSPSSGIVTLQIKLHTYLKEA
jgi:type IV pilus assembly protein PilO